MDLPFGSRMGNIIPITFFPIYLENKKKKKKKKKKRVASPVHH
jgi:hypothetical protein